MKSNYSKIKVSFIFIIIIVLLAVYFGGCMSSNDKIDDTVKIENEVPIINVPQFPSGESKLTDDDDESENYISAAVIGLDKSGLLTDVMMVGVFNTKTYMIDLFSIPRDTKIELNEQLYNEINEKGWIPSVVKLNELHSWVSQSNIENPMSYTFNALEEITGIEIDYYAIVDTNSFDKVVDAVGGVELYVPRDMNYEDPNQNLYIHLKKGNQVLNGDEAEQFVRFRGYPNGDLDRVEMQQYFMKGFLDSLLKFNNIFRIREITTSVNEMISTNLSVTDIPKYIQYIDNLSISNLRTHTIPGKEDHSSGPSFYVIESFEDTHAYIQTVIEKGSPTYENSKNYAIELINSGYSIEVADKYKKLLNDDGYNVISTNTQKMKSNKTKIITSEQSIGEDLLQYFNFAELVYDPSSLPNGVDIQIVLGITEK